MKTFLLLTILIVGCANCSYNLEPRIITIEGIEHCSAMCNKFKELDCKPYYEDVISMDGSKMTCTEFCEYEMKNSVDLKPLCLSVNLTKCEDIEVICK
jgi:hypothetical protein